MTLQLKTVSASRGPRWVVDAFRLFARKPLLFTMMFAVFLFAALLVSLVPLLGGLVQMATLPLLSLGFMIAGQSALNGGPVHPAQFLEPLRGDPTRRRSLLILCAIYGVAALAILMLADAVSDNAWARLQALMMQGQPAQAEIDALLSEPGVATGLLLAGCWVPRFRWFSGTPRRWCTGVARAWRRPCSPARWRFGAARAPSSPIRWPGRA